MTSFVYKYPLTGYGFGPILAGILLKILKILSQLMNSACVNRLYLTNVAEKFYGYFHTEIIEISIALLDRYLIFFY